MKSLNCKVDYALYTDNMQSEYAKDIKAFYIPNKYLKFNNNEIDLENERFISQQLLFKI